MIILSVVVCYIHAPTLTETVPRWVFFLNAFCLFAYQTLDNLDGKQARNTGQSSPLGEMFDHGCDAVSCTLGAFNWLVLCSQGPSLFSFSVILVAWLPFACATWEEYYVGGLFLGYLNGPIEGLLSMQFAQVVAGILGHQFWHMTLEQFSPLIAQLLPFAAHFPLCYFVTGLTLFLAFLNSSINIVNVYQQVQKNAKLQNLTQEERVWRERSFLGALRKLIPFAILIVGAALWLLLSPSNIFASHTYLFLIATGLWFGYLASNVTLAFLLKTSLVEFSFACLPIMLCTLNALLSRFIGLQVISEAKSLYLYSIAAIVVYAHFVITVCTQISSYLGIGVLRILPARTPSPSSRGSIKPNHH